MRRAFALALVTMLLGAHSARGQVTIIDRLNQGAYAGVTHANALRVEDVGGGGDSVNVFHQSTIRHISSVVHLGGFIGIRDGLCPTCWARVDHAGALATTATVTTDNVNVFHQSTVRHVSSMTHVVIVDWQRWAHIQASQSGAWVVTAAHQGGTPWVIAHVSSVIHIAAVGPAPVSQALATRCVNTAGTAFEACGGAGGTADAVNVFHQSTVRHVSSVSHVQIVGPSYGGTTQAEVKQGAPGSVAPWPVVSHAQQSGAWTVQAAHLAGVPSVSQGSVWAVLAHAQQSGSWTVQAAHQGGQWNVAHVGSVVHVSIVQGTSGGASHVLVAPVYQAGPWTVAANQSGAFTIQAAHQGGTPWTTSHVSSVVHVASVVTRATIPCPSTAAVNQTAGATVVTGAAGRFVQICSIILVSDTAQNLSVTEGTGTVCATGPAALIGGTTASVSVAAQGGFSAVSGVPWLVTATSGDNVCVLQSGTGNVSGTITFRLTP